jgi:hypothetical protein
MRQRVSTREHFRRGNARPNTASFATRDDLDPGYAGTLTTYRTGILSRIGLWN